MSQISDLISSDVYDEIRGDGNISEMIFDLLNGDPVAVSDDVLDRSVPSRIDGLVATYGIPAQTIRQIPANEEYPGEYGFNFKLSNGLSGKKAWEFSPELNKVYIDMDVKLSVEFQWTPPHQWLYVRATPRFSEPQHANESVQRCITHSNDRHPSNRDCSPDMLPHVIRCHNEGSEYVAIGNELSVRTPLGSPQCGSERVTLLYSFMCKNSCTTGMNRRPIQVVYTLENASGAVLGRRKHDVRICSCPKRDREKDETGSFCRKTTKKRKVDGKAVQKTMSRVKEEPSSFEVVSMPEFRIVGLENRRKILSYAYDLMAGEARRTQAYERYDSVIDEIQALIDNTN